MTGKTELAELLLDFRAKYNLTQRETCYIIGVTNPSMIGNWERGGNYRETTLRRIRAAMERYDRMTEIADKEN